MAYPGVDKYGHFSRAGYLEHDGLGKEPAATQKIEFDATGGGIRDKGLQFKATVGRRGKNNDATFDKYKPLHVGDKFVDPSRKTLQAANAGKDKRVTDLPFKSPKPAAKSTGMGSYHGTIGGKWQSMPEEIAVPLQKGDVQEKARGIFTNPPKKGSFGMNKFTLSERQGHKGVAGEYEYLHDPASHHAKQRNEARLAHKKACVTDMPFKPSNPPKKGTYGMINTTISKGQGVAGEYEYKLVAGDEGPKQKFVGEDINPFRPSNAHAADRTSHIPYIHDPMGAKKAKESAAKLAESKRLAETGAWRPNMSYKSDMVRSVVRMNIPRC